MSDSLKKITKDKNFLSLPWVESPFFYDLLKNNNHTKEESDLATQFHENGYVIVDLNLDDNFLKKLISDMYKGVERENVKVQAEFYTYSESPRIFEEWRVSESIQNLCLHPKLIDTLEFLYNKKTFPFSTINFIKGSNQPLHSDAIHFHTIPQLWMSGVWVALEDTNEENGTLNIVPGSHKWQIIDYETLNLPHPDTIENGEMENYRIYEEVISKLVESKKSTVKPVSLKKGQALIWAANLLHGGMKIKNPNSTRLTQAIHYFYDDCRTYYHPMFSNKYEGKYAKKWCDQTKNIRTYEKP
jgi:ectoine hydroxylase-related dioxygenase (phytanoyl-CoA dioxygenase family)